MTDRGLELDAVDTTDRRARECRTLGQLGAVFRTADLPKIRVLIPRQLADEAVAAWERDDDGGIERPEDPAARVQRHRAGVLALIGLSVTDDGIRDADGNVAVDLDPELIGMAMDSADDL